VIFLPVSFVLLAAAAVEPPTCKTSDPRVEQFIATTAKDGGGEENCQFRLYQTLSDVDGDRREDFLVVFSVDGEGGGNSTTQYLAVFPTSTTWKPSIVEVGRRGNRQVRSLYVESGVIVLDALDYGPDDAMCCPSVRAEGRLRYAKGRITPVASPAPPAH
jgi:hypothetical protein